jgi:hypothetical protein
VLITFVIDICDLYVMGTFFMVKKISLSCRANFDFSSLTVSCHVLCGEECTD